MSLRSTIETQTLAELGSGQLSLGEPSSARRVRDLAHFLGQRLDPRRPAAAFAVPGRIELIGKHVDYAGGHSLTCATRRGFLLVATPRDDDRLVVHDRGRRQTVTLATSSLDEIGPETPGWSRYPRALFRRLAADFPAFASQGGVEVALTSDLPPSSGLSSSSALVVTVWTALAWAARLRGGDLPAALRPTERLAGYLGAAEAGRPFAPCGRGAADATGEGVGTRGGAQDHTAILCAKAGHVLQARYAPERVERRIALPSDLRLLVATSGVRARKAGKAQAPYNRLADQARAIVKAWQRASGSDHPTVGAALDGGATADDLISAVAGEAPLARRLEQMLAEEDAVRAAGDALAVGDHVRFGCLIDRSQSLAETHLGNQIPETVFLARTARKLGAVAASAFGAGFGGAVWAMVGDDRSSQLLAAWEDRYLRRFPERSERSAFLVEEAGPPVRRLA